MYHAMDQFTAAVVLRFVCRAVSAFVPTTYPMFLYFMFCRSPALSSVAYPERFPLENLIFVKCSGNAETEQKRIRRFQWQCMRQNPVSFYYYWCSSCSITFSVFVGDKFSSKRMIDWRHIWVVSETSAACTALQQSFVSGLCPAWPLYYPSTTFCHISSLWRLQCAFTVYSGLEICSLEESLYGNC